MITLLIVIFFIAIITAFTMLAFRAWELRTGRITSPEGQTQSHIPEFSFRQLEKTMLYITKHVVQWIVLTTVKYWFIGLAKTKKWLLEKWPHIHKHFEKDTNASPQPIRHSFVKRAVLESKAKIQKIKERVKEDHL
ncbi:MAG: hypothetical protein KBB75_01625 [Candidatus Pacebacteria bacterium]|nr:hypothetical protein [Candidatus Paceibacterota bacterium]